MRHHCSEASFKPKVVVWELTKGCNLRCIHCSRDAAELLSPNDLSYRECCRVADQLAEFAPLNLILGGGEPLWRRDVFDIAGYARERGMEVELVTNGTLVDEAMAERIREAGIRRVSVTVDGRDATTHDTFRGHQGAFHAAVRGIRLLQRLGVVTQLHTTVSRHNAHELPDILKLAQNLNVRAFHLFLLTPSGCGLAIQDDRALGAAEAEEILRWFAERSGHSEVGLEAVCAPHYVRIRRQRRDDGAPEHDAKRAPIGKNRYDGPGCQAGRASCFISHRGEVFACGYLPIPAGNLFERSFREIWETAPIFEELRDPERIHGKCGICEFHDVCTGCRGRAYALTGDYLDEEPRCIYEPGRSYAES